MSKKRRKKKAKNKTRREEKRKSQSISIDMMSNLIAKRPQLEVEYHQAVSDLRATLDGFDKLEVLSHISYISFFTSEDNPGLNDELRSSMPLVHFLTGLCLNSANTSAEQPTQHEIAKIIDQAKSLLGSYSFLTMVIDRERGASDAAHTARLQAHLGQMNPSSYPDQTRRLISNVYGAFNKALIEEYGYKADTANLAADAVRRLYEDRVNAHKHDTQIYGEQIRNDPSTLAEAEKIAVELNAETEEVIGSMIFQKHFSNLRSMLTFVPNDLFPYVPIEEVVRIARYLGRRSSKFACNEGGYTSLDSPNRILTHPVLETENGYFMCPLINELHFTAPEFLERELLAISNGELLNRLKDIKGDFVEDGAYGLFARIFGKENCHRNLTFWVGSQNYETDLLILYDNRIISVESKSGKLTAAAKRGAPKGLETDLKKLMESAFIQSNRAFDYIRGQSGEVVFYDEQRRPKLKFPKPQAECQYIPISITLEPLLKYAANPKSLQEIGFFKNDEFPWPVQLSELECVLPCFHHPSIFIHYLEGRFRAMKENIFQAFDELSLLGWYLRNGNFFVPKTGDGNDPTAIMLDGFLKEFDDHYLFGKPAPSLAIEPEFLEMIKFLERERPLGYTAMTCALLNIPRGDRKKLIGAFSDLKGMSASDGKPHDLTVIYGTDTGPWGITLMTQMNQEELRVRLAGHCMLKKYQMHARSWIGIGKNVGEPFHYANEFAFLEGDWMFDEHLEKTVFAAGLNASKKGTNTVLDRFNKKMRSTGKEER